MALYLFVTGSVSEGFILLACGIFIIAMIDNFLRPLLVGWKTRIADPLVLISTLWGIAIPRLNGLIIGPVLAALFVTFWTLRR